MIFGFGSLILGLFRIEIELCQEAYGLGNLLFAGTLSAAYLSQELLFIYVEQLRELAENIVVVHL